MSRDILKTPIFVALDVDTKDKAVALAEQVKDYVGGFKVGPRLCMRYGASIVEELSKLGPVFVDNKYYDIPNTMEAALRVTFSAGASFTTIHANLGFEGLRRMATVERELNTERPFKILAVTVLTSYDESNMPPNWRDDSVEDHVSSLAKCAIDAGLSGLVCSAKEVTHLRNQYPEVFLLTPGIRLPDTESGDQKRVVTPGEAIGLGSSALVVGRPIIEAKDPAAVAKSFFEAVTD